mmetsp:Transcript_6446/g.14065  ORF Transcript_6446/g.14065 Transcript_6446/m.14065 type:complete len:227 (+) Transcript_6446:37-717(+)
MAPARRGGRGWGSSAKNSRTEQRLQRLAAVSEASELTEESLECEGIDGLQPSESEPSDTQDVQDAAAPIEQIPAAHTARQSVRQRIPSSRFAHTSETDAALVLSVSVSTAQAALQRALAHAVSADMKASAARAEAEYRYNWETAAERRCRYWNSMWRQERSKRKAVYYRCRLQGMPLTLRSRPLPCQLLLPRLRQPPLLPHHLNCRLQSFNLKLLCRHQRCWHYCG